MKEPEKIIELLKKVSEYAIEENLCILLTASVAEKGDKEMKMLTMFANLTAPQVYEAHTKLGARLTVQLDDKFNNKP